MPGQRPPVSKASRPDVPEKTRLSHDRPCEARVKQADEHDDKQNDVCNKQRDDGCHIAPDVGYAAFVLRLNHCRADLQLNKPKNFKYLG